MDHRNRISSLLMIVILAISAAVPVQAQEAVPPGQQPPAPKNPAVASILSSNPATPTEWVRAADMLAKLGRADLGRPFLRRVIDAQLGDDQLAALAEQYGSGVFRSMAAQEQMLPEAGQLADAILAVVRRSINDPAQIAQRIGQLRDPSPEVRYRALAGLKQAGSAAVGPLLSVLADADRAAEHDAVRAVLVEIDSDAVGPLLALLEASDPKLVVESIRTLAQMGRKQAVLYLLRPCVSQDADPAVRAVAAAALRRLVGQTPTRGEAAGLLTEQARAYFDRKQPIREDADGRVRIWHWDGPNEQCTSKSYLADEAASAMAARLARDAYALAGDDPQVRLLYLTTMLEAAAGEVGLDQPLPMGEGTVMAEVARLGTGKVEQLFRHALADDRVAAATAAARLLGRIGTAEELLRGGPRPSALVSATRHPDRRLRLAATKAVVQLQPTRPFPGASYIPQSLAFFAASSGTRRALVAGPSTENSRRLAGMLTGLGLQVDTALTGRELGRLATTSPDYELALIDAVIEGPTVDLLLPQLRQDCRSATLRVGVIARGDHLERARRAVRRDPLALAFVRPHNDASFAQQMQELTALAPRAFVDHAQRQRQAAAALDHLVELSRAKNRYCEIGVAQEAVLVALHAPGLGIQAAAVLGNLGNPESQRALVELASRWTQPLALRQAAAEAFRRNVQASGILLTTRQIARQYDRYNQSENRDAPTQKVLGSILDAIESAGQTVQVEGEDGKPKAEG